MHLVGFIIRKYFERRQIIFCTEMVLPRSVGRHLQFYTGFLQNFRLYVRVTQKYAHTQSVPLESTGTVYVGGVLLSDPGLFMSQRR